VEGNSNRLCRNLHCPWQTTFFLFMYAAQTLLCPKGFHYLPNLCGSNRIQQNALDPGSFNKRSSSHHGAGTCQAPERH